MFLSASGDLGCERPPLVQCDQTSMFVDPSGDEMAFQIEVVLDLVVN
jgi:hypothetical protein